MVKLTKEMQAAFSQVAVFPVATAAADGTPNVVPMGACRLADDETIWIADVLMKQTLLNVKENPKIAIYVWGPEIEGCIQIKGDVEIKTEGPEVDEMNQILHRDLGEEVDAKGVLVVKVKEVYECTAGPDAGKKLL